MRFRLRPTSAQEAALLEHCAHARYVWNLACEQHLHWRPGRVSAPGYAEQCRQLTEARREFGWLAAGSQTVRQQALRDFAQTVANFFAGTRRRPRWRKAGVHEGFRVVGRRGAHWDVRRLSRKVGEVRIRRLARAARGSNRHKRIKTAIARLKARETDRRKDWVEKTSIDLARRLDLIRIEDLKIGNMVRSARGTIAALGVNVRAKAGLNRSIHAAGWGLLARRLEHKAADRVEKINPAYTSQTCHACGHCAADNRESQAVFRCRACGHTDHADVNAAKNIAVGRTVTCLPRPTDPDRPPVRGALQPLGGALNREPQHVLSSV
ncbi:RNA-guided endonuclease InsQ/TnpB family protein [Actinoallomurus sp. CA-142502]|uniref:RNA-guided endonuclease InsQ/TnpB family protein n=1 Tax=Actinoallomurus sp. CA-142502 TaxID=3239885 RepID=UPI003D8A8B92